MRKVCLSVFAFLMLFFLILPLDAYSQGQKIPDPYSKANTKKRNKMARAKVKELKKEGWKVDGSKPLDVILNEHYLLLENGDNQEMVADANCKSIGVCKEKMFDDVCRSYASSAGSFVKGRITSDKNTDQSLENAEAEFDKMYAAYERLVAATVKGEIKTSVTIYKEDNGVKHYRTFYIINEEQASKARLDAMRRAAEETKIAQEYAKRISDFVKEGFEVPEK